VIALETTAQVLWRAVHRMLVGRASFELLLVLGLDLVLVSVLLVGMQP